MVLQPEEQTTGKGPTFFKDGRKVMTREDAYKADAERMEDDRIRNLGSWQHSLIILRIAEAKIRHDAEDARILKDTSAITSAQTLVSDLKRLHFSFAPGQAESIIETDQRIREQIADWATGKPKPSTTEK